MSRSLINTANLSGRIPNALRSLALVVVLVVVVLVRAGCGAML